MGEDLVWEVCDGARRLGRGVGWWRCRLDVEGGEGVDELEDVRWEGVSGAATAM